MATLHSNIPRISLVLMSTTLQWIYRLPHDSSSFGLVTSSTGVSGSGDHIATALGSQLTTGLFGLAANEINSLYQKATLRNSSSFV